MPIAEPGGVARGCSQRSGTGGAAAEGGVRAARGSVRAARGECPRRPGKPAAATGEASRGDRGSQPRRPGAVQDGPGCSRRPGRPILAVREPVRAARQGFCPRRPAGVLSAATGRGSVRGDRQGFCPRQPAGVLSAATGEGLRRRTDSQRAPPIRAAREPSSPPGEVPPTRGGR